MWPSPTTASTGAVIDRIVAGVGRRLDESSPMVDARLPDGSRVNAVIPPLALDGPDRSPSASSAPTRYGVEDLVNLGTLSLRAGAVPRGVRRGKQNILISGGTGSGKTTTAQRAVGVHPAQRAHHHHRGRQPSCSFTSRTWFAWRPARRTSKARARSRIRDLVSNALRMRPDRIVVGECRGGEALDMLQAMNTGHDGSLTTVHANSARDALSRLETMVLMAGFDLPVEPFASRSLRHSISSSIRSAAVMANAT